MFLKGRFVSSLGRYLISLLEEMGRWTLLLLAIIRKFPFPPYRFGQILAQMEFAGIGSIGVVCLTGVFVGAVFAVQLAIGLSMAGLTGLVGSSVGLTLSREVGPMLTALMVTGRVGSAMAATIGTMKVSEQVDALEAMAVDPIDYLVMPRVIACTLVVPMLTMLFNGVGVLGAWYVGYFVLGIDNGMFWGRFDWYVDPDDFTDGLIKSAVFGFILSWIGCSRGLATTGGAEGVGKSTTQAVVFASVSILVSDYFITRLLY